MSAGYDKSSPDEVYTEPILRESIGQFYPATPLERNILNTAYPCISTSFS